MTDIPPKVVKYQVESLRDLWLEKRHPGGLQTADGQPLPVLEAFQKFLEAERRKTTRRLTAIMAVSLLVLVLVAGAVVAISVVTLNRMNRDVNQIQAQVAAFRDETTRLKSESQEKVDQLKQELLQGQGARGDDSAKLASKVSGYGTELTKLASTMQALQKENGSLKGEVLRLQAGVPNLSNTVQQVLLSMYGRPSPGPVQPTAQPDRPLSALAKTPEVIPAENKNPVASPAVAAPRVIVLALALTNSEVTVPWCIPIPE